MIPQSVMKSAVDEGTCHHGECGYDPDKQVSEMKAALDERLMVELLSGLMKFRPRMELKR